MSLKALKDLELCKHPNSRKTIALTKQMKKVTRREKSKLGQVLKQNIVGEKLLWFKERLDPDIVSYTPLLTLELISKYLDRFSDELEQIRLKHSIGQRKNRQHANREDIINLTIKRELEEFTTCGIELPNIMQPKILDSFRKWNGELRFIQNFKLIRISKKHLDRQMEKFNTKPVVVSNEINSMNVE